MVTGSYLNLDVAPPDISDAGVRFLSQKAKMYYLYNVILMIMPFLHVGPADF